MILHIRGKPKNKKKHKRDKYIDYDYEEAFNKNITDLKESEIDKMLQEGKIKSIYATKTIKSGNQFEIELYPEFTRKKDIPKYKLKDEAQKKLNDKNARKHFTRLINTNFKDGYWITFTYSNDHLPSDLERARKDMQNYIKKMNRWRKKKGMDNMKYVYVTEWNDKKKIRCHHHLICSTGLSLDEMEKGWTKCKRKEIRRIDYDDENALNALGDYLTKDPAGKKRWCSSKNLKKPTVHKNHQTFRMKQIKEMVRDQNAIERYMTLKYPNYQYVAGEIYFNDFNARYYIHARMRERCPSS